MIAEKTPYFIYPMLDVLETTSDREERRRLKQAIALNVGSTETLRELFGLDSESLADFYNDMSSPHPTTDDTIDSFLRQFGRPSARAGQADDRLFAGEGVPGIDPLLGGADVPSDYMASLAASDSQDILQTGTSSGSMSDGESGGIHYLEADSISGVGSDGDGSDSTADSGSLTAGFARILVKNGNYAKALEIISGLYLNNPEKSIYFADQIRFIRKLMLNQSKKQ